MLTPPNRSFSTKAVSLSLTKTRRSRLSGKLCRAGSIGCYPFTTNPSESLFLALHRVYHSPIEGFYDSDTNNGRSNTNDIFVFMTDTNQDVVNVRGDPQAGIGQMYAFQFPTDYFVTEDSTSLAVIFLGGVRRYQAHTAPVLADEGQSLYWPMVRGEVRGWVEQRFSRGNTATLNLGRGEPAYIAPRSSPTLSHDPVDFFVCGPGSSSVVWRADRTMTNLTMVPTDAVVSSRLAVTFDEQFILYGTQGGLLSCANSQDLSTVWTVGDGALSLDPIKGDIAVDATRVYVGDDQGNGVGQVVGLEIAYVVESPSSAPSSVPSTVPTLDSATTAAPTLATTELPTTHAPTRLVDLATASPTTRPSLSITPLPTRASSVASAGVSPVTALGALLWIGFTFWLAV